MAWPQVVRALAVTRVLTGAVGLVARPAWLGALFGPRAQAPLPRSLVRLAAVRDVALGVGTFAATGESAPSTARLAGLGALCDATDAAVVAAMPGMGRRARAVTVATASLAAVSGAVAARRVAASADRPG